MSTAQYEYRTLGCDWLDLPPSWSPHVVDEEGILVYKMPNHRWDVMQPGEWRVKSPKARPPMVDSHRVYRDRHGVVFTVYSIVPERGSSPPRGVVYLSSRSWTRVFGDWDAVLAAYEEMQEVNT